MEQSKISTRTIMFETFQWKSTLKVILGQKQTCQYTVFRNSSTEFPFCRNFHFVGIHKWIVISCNNGMNEAFMTINCVFFHHTIYFIIIKSHFCSISHRSCVSSSSFRQICSSASVRHFSVLTSDNRNRELSSLWKWNILKKSIISSILNVHAIWYTCDVFFVRLVKVHWNTVIFIYRRFRIYRMEISGTSDWMYPGFRK